MPTITISVSDADKRFMKAMAKSAGVSLSELIPTKTLEALEEDYDAKVVAHAYQEYHEDLAKGINPTSWEDMLLELDVKKE